MRQIIMAVALGVGLLGLGACAGATKSVDNAGTTTVDLQVDQDGNLDLHAVTGKEYDSIEATVDLAAKTGSFSATNARGLQAQLAAAEVEKRFAEFYENATPELAAILDKLMESMKAVYLGGI